MWAKGEGGQQARDKVEYRSGWRDLNSRPLDPQIGGDMYVGLKRAGMK
jgi:hypothetical protein